MSEQPDDRPEEDSTGGSGGIKRRLVVLAAILAVPVLLAWGFYHCYVDLDPGEGPAGPTVPDAPFQSTWGEQRVLLLGVGDSITAGWGARAGYSYFDRLAETPPEEWPEMEGKSLGAVYPQLEARNIAVSGSDSCYHASTMVESLEQQPDDVFGIIVMTSGGNDLIHSYGRQPPRECAMYGATREQARPWVAAYEERLRRMLTMLREKFPGGCRVFLANIYDPTDGTSSPSIAPLPDWPDALDILAAYNEVIARAARELDYVHLVDIHGPFLGHGLHCRKPWTEHYRAEDPHYWYGKIIEDPNDRGYDAIRRLFLLEMIEVLAPSRRG
jgi:lysophospholipase L1-like esterase